MGVNEGLRHEKDYWSHVNRQVELSGQVDIEVDMWHWDSYIHQLSSLWIASFISVLESSWKDYMYWTAVSSSCERSNSDTRLIVDFTVIIYIQLFEYFFSLWECMNSCCWSVWRIVERFKSNENVVCSERQ